MAADLLQVAVEEGCLQIVEKPHINSLKIIRSVAENTREGFAVAVRCGLMNFERR